MLKFKPIVLFSLFTALIVFPCAAKNKKSDKKELSQWNEGETLSVIKSYVKSVTDKKSSEYIPPEDRIAVFDLDGTIYGEQFPTNLEWMLYCQRVMGDEKYIPTAPQIDVAKAILESSKTKKIPSDLPAKERMFFGQAFEYMTAEDFRLYVSSFLDTAADGFIGMTLREAFFLPMLELADYLKNNDFQIFICTETDRDLAREIVCKMLEIPETHVIGTDYFKVSDNQNANGYDEYQLTQKDAVIRTDKILIDCTKMGKVAQIAREIGKKPVLAFGNSINDFSLFMYTTNQNRYKAHAFCIIPDDEFRDYLILNSIDKLKDMCKDNQWNAVSMRKSFKSLYREDVVRKPENREWYIELVKTYETDMKK